MHDLGRPRQDRPAQLVHDRALLVHHVVELERALADGVVLLLHAALRGLHRLVQPAVLHHLALLHAEAQHDARDLLRPEEAHEIVLERNVELGTTGITLTRAAATQLAVDTTALMALRTNDVEALRMCLEDLLDRVLRAGKLVLEIQSLVLQAAGVEKLLHRQAALR